MANLSYPTKIAWMLTMLQNGRTVLELDEISSEGEAALSEVLAPSKGLGRWRTQDTHKEKSLDRITGGRPVALERLTHLERRLDRMS